MKYDNKSRERRNAWLRKWCKDNPELRFMRYWRHRLKSRYGMRPEDFKDLLDAQDGRCMICNQTMIIPTADNRVRNGKSVVVDHSHKTDQVRALLCNNCNRALGMFDHSVQVLSAAVSYLKIFGEG